MMASRLSFAPIRLDLRRVGNGRWEVIRAGKIMGVVARDGDHWGIVSKGHYQARGPYTFKAAVLNVAREDTSHVNEKYLTWEPVELSRRQVDTVWWCLVRYPNGQVEVFEENPASLEGLGDEWRARMLKALLASSDR